MRWLAGSVFRELLHHVFYRGEPEKPRLTKVFATANEPSAECGPASYPAKRTEVAAR